MAVALEAEEVAVLVAEDLAVVQVVVEEQPEVGDYLMNRIKKYLVPCFTLIWLLTLQNEIHAQVQIPAAPANEGHGDFLQDYAGIINPNAPELKAIGKAQQIAFEQHDTPIVVVVITRMASFGYQGDEIAPYAADWFNKWDIGTLGVNGKNRGILLLISIGDRKARIELGRDWARRFDHHCQQIMDKAIIPNFKAGNFTKGIQEGVQHLELMAVAGPIGQVKAFSKRKSNFVIKNKLLGNLPFPLWVTAILIVLAIIAIVYAVQRSDGFVKKACILLGIALGLLAIYPPGIILLGIAVLASFLPSDGGGGGSSYSFGSSSSYSSSSYSSGGSSYSGGGYSGGSSGGGGASGSW